MRRWADISRINCARNFSRSRASAEESNGNASSRFVQRTTVPLSCDMPLLRISFSHFSSSLSDGTSKSQSSVSYTWSTSHLIQWRVERVLRADFGFEDMVNVRH